MEEATSAGSRRAPPEDAESAEDALARARSLVDAARWEEALAALQGLDDPDGAADALELRARAEYGRGAFEEAVACWERLHQHHLSRGEPGDAARAAALGAMHLLMDTGLMAPVRGWLRRAERLVADDEESPARALIAMTRAYERFICGDLESAAARAAEAVECGERLGVLPAVVLGRVAAARIATLTGAVEDGLAELEEVGSLLMSGEVDPLTTGMMYCELICAAQGLGLHQLAAEWTEVMEHWRHDAAFGGIHGRCRVHRAELLRLSGPCEDAEAEALAACAELRPWLRREFGWPLVELGVIRMRKGDLDGAEEALLEADRHAWSPQPGLALLHLERGDVDGAAALIAGAVEHPARVPWKERPPHGGLQLVPLLEAQVEVAAAAGDRAVAGHAAERLEEILAEPPSPTLRAVADLARARAALLDGDDEQARDHASRALEVWAALQAPYETAAARTVLGRAQQRLGDHRAARRAWEAAWEEYRRFGAHRRATQLEELLDEPSSGSVTSGTLAGEFRQEDGLRVVALDGRRVRVADLTGHRHIQRLLARPGREVPALELVRAEQGAAVEASDEAPGQEDLTCAVGESALPTLDDRAREAYRRRLAEIEEDIDDARACHDPDRQELAERDRDFLIAELRRATGLGGRPRRSGGGAERARSSVTRSIRYALQAMREHHPEAAAHLETTIRTGTRCCYSPDPLITVDWTT